MKNKMVLKFFIGLYRNLKNSYTRERGSRQVGMAENSPEFISGRQKPRGFGEHNARAKRVLMFVLFFFAGAGLYFLEFRTPLFQERNFILENNFVSESIFNQSPTTNPISNQNGQSPDLKIDNNNSSQEESEKGDRENLETKQDNEDRSEKKKFKLEVPFTSQAPFANWDNDHNNACEEASILMAHYFLEKKKLTPKIAEKEILEMIDYQRKNWASHRDLDAEETAKLAKEFYGYKNVEVKYDISIEDIKKEITRGNPVILPMAGRLLKNPYFRQPGPLYHMLTAIGFDDENQILIVNDPGTKRGQNFSYKYQIIENALHEFKPDDITKGRKAMIVIKRD